MMSKAMDDSAKTLSTKPKCLPGIQGAKRQFMFAMSGVFVVWAVGALVVGLNENLTFVDAIYWSAVTSGTIGYGDLPLNKRSTRVFVIFFIFVAMGR
jgi:hypothetical protein